MNTRNVEFDPIEVLVAARKVADFAAAQGVGTGSHRARATCEHLGAVLADSILQAGLNYASVVQPRVSRILTEYPDTDTTAALSEIVRNQLTSDFLNWTHPVKIMRFERLVFAIDSVGVKDASGLRKSLDHEAFCDELQTLNGVGPKTIDYMACLLGIESIAVDRHVRTFATQVGIESSNYHFLKRVFCFAADLLSVSRREFDAWVWRRESSRHSRQLSLFV